MNLRGGILALDLATQVGWCFGRPNDRPVMGTIRLSNSFGNGEIGNSLLSWLSDAITTMDPGLVLFEAPLPRGHHSSIQAARIALGLAMMTEAVCWYRERPCREAHVMTVRKGVIGSGNANKDAVMAWALAQGWAPDSADAADACAVWAYGCLNHQHMRAAA